MTSAAHQAQPVVHSLQVIDHGPLILALLPTPGAVGYATEVFRSCIPISPITFRDSEGGTAQKNLRPLGKALRA